MASNGGIDSRAIVDPAASIGGDVYVGPYCMIGPDVSIGDRCRLEAHTIVHHDTEIGEENRVGPMASIGGDPQDLKYGGEKTRLKIGARNRIHEYVTLNRGTAGGGEVTTIGDDNLFMIYAHVGHDCRVVNRIVFANAATLAGHVDVGDDATVGAYSGVHQFCRVARHAFIGGYSVVTQDALPWVLTVGNRATTHGLNLVGLRRAGYPRETIDALKRCYQQLFRSKMRVEEAIDSVEKELGHVEQVRYFLEFVRTSKRGVCR
jgi:UDP-N-acetylglucosamine acyltransferase